MHDFRLNHRLLLSCVAVLALACGDDGKDEGADGDTGTAEGAESGDAPETSGSSMEGDGDGDGDTGDGDGDGEPGDGDGDPNSPCFDHETQDDCEADPACQSVNGQPLQTNGPDSPCLDPAEYLGCIPMMICDDALTWFCIGGNEKPVLVNNGCGPEGAEMCLPMVGDPPECP
jgi:hypothetical protein